MSINICGRCLELRFPENALLFPELAERLTHEAEQATPLRFLPRTPMPLPTPPPPPPPDLVPLEVSHA